MVENLNWLREFKLALETKGRLLEKLNRYKFGSKNYSETLREYEDASMVCVRLESVFLGSICKIPMKEPIEL